MSGERPHGWKVRLYARPGNAQADLKVRLYAWPVDAPYGWKVRLCARR